MAGLLRASVMVVVAVVMGAILAVNVLIEGRTDVTNRSDIGGW